MIRRRWIAVAAAMAAGLAALVLVEAPGSASPRDTGRAPATQRAVSTPPVSAYCRRGSTRTFRPKTVTIPHITRHARVLALPRHGAARIRSAPVTDKGARQFAWDAPRPRPGNRHGHVLLNAHTWPWSDPIALGNAMLERLRVGHKVVIHGVRNGHKAHLCYRVVKQVEIRANQRYAHYYSRTGRPRIAFMVCSGTRRGPGDWDHRMIWFAKPYGVHHKRHHASTSPTPQPTSSPSPTKPPLIVLPPLLGG